MYPPVRAGMFWLLYCLSSRLAVRIREGRLGKIVGNDTLIRTGVEDIFVAKLGYGSSVGINEINKKEEFVLFPNPFDYKLNILTKEKEQLEIILYDIAFRKLLQQKFTNTVTLNTAQLAKGIYIYEVRPVPMKSGNENEMIKKGKVVKDWNCTFSHRLIFYDPALLFTQLIGLITCD